MTREEAIEELKRDIHNAKVTHHLSEHYEMAIDALETIGHLTDRPCNVCEFHGKNGCCKWDCVFKGV